ncbi:MAG: carbohydrate porin, partial [Gammaproteobacteria bacterium]
TEVYYRWQVAEEIAITPSVQLLIDPALNPEEDTLWVFGLRARFAFYNLNLASVERCSHD